MEKRGAKPKGKVRIKWSPDFAYAIGLLASDGNVSSDGRHITFTSKDLEQMLNFNKALGTNVHVGKKAGSVGSEKKYHVVQFSDVLFYEFLVGIGIMPVKSKVLGEVKVPPELFFHFLRGCFDGDGCSYSYWDKRWKSSFMLYAGFCSASLPHLSWIRDFLHGSLGISGHVSASKSGNCYQLRYAKTEARKMIERMYEGEGIIYLSRKRLKIEASLCIMVGQEGVRASSLDKNAQVL